MDNLSYIYLFQNGMREKMKSVFCALYLAGFGGMCLVGSIFLYTYLFIEYNTGHPPGVVIKNSPSNSHNYIGSPSIVIMDDGTYVASHDFFGSGNLSGLSRIYKSKDKGLSWIMISEIDQFWSGLFIHNENLYIMGCEASSGNVIIRRSGDGGFTWSEPSDADSGRILKGQFHTAPMPVVEYAGRLWRSIETVKNGQWPDYFETAVLSAPMDADLLNANSWTLSNSLPYNRVNFPGEGWLEGNLVITPEGSLVNILRLARTANLAAVVRINDDEKIYFEPLDGFINLPGGCKKFTIRFDPLSERYWSITNHVLFIDRFKNLRSEWIRNRAVLISSPDLINWSIERLLVYHPNVYKNGYQYWDWVFDESDIIAVSRTAHKDSFGRAVNYHDANYLTFHRISYFRQSP